MIQEQEQGWERAVNLIRVARAGELENWRRSQFRLSTHTCRSAIKSFSLKLCDETSTKQELTHCCLMIVMVLQNRRLLAHWGRVLEEHHYHQSMVIFQSTTPVRAGRGRASHLVRLARAGELEKELESNFYNSHTEK